MKSIKTELLLIFSVLIIIPLITLGSITYLQSSRALQKTIDASTMDIAQGTANLLNSELSSIRRILALIQSDESVHAFLGNKSDLDREQAFSTLKNTLANNQDILESIMIVNTDKIAVISNSDSNIAIDLSERAYLIPTMNGESSISNLLTSKLTGNNVVVIAEPIISDGKVIGAVLGTMLFSHIENLIEDIQIGEEGYAYIIDDTGVIIAHPNKDHIKNKTNLLNLNNPQLEEVIGRMIAGEKSNGFYTFEGIYKMVAFAPVGNWSLAVTANYSDYMSAAIDIRSSAIIITLLAIIISLIIALLFSSMFVKPIRQLQSLMKQAGDGILTVKSQVGRKDEIGDLSNSFNDMIVDLNEIVKNVRAGAADMVAMATDLAATSEELNAIGEETRAKSEQIANDTEEQNIVSIEVSEALIELSSLVVLAKNKAIGADETSRETKEMALQGREKVKSTVEAMELISNKSGIVSSSINDVDLISKRISQITLAIGDVADQTNLLALNAAIEAARAGEQGKGFMVVADEIRKLAEQTNSESEQIRNLIDEMVLKIQTAVDSVAASLQSIDDGNHVVDETDAFFLQIVDAVEKTAADIADILQITKNEVATSDQIVQLVDGVSSRSEQNLDNIKLIHSNIYEQAMALENISASSEETNAVAESLSDMVERFVIDEKKDTEVL